VIFKSHHKIDIPKTDFFDYVLGDISDCKDKPAITDGLTGRTMSFQELKSKSQRLGQSMVERGYRRGDVVAIMSPNVIEYVITFFGCAYVGLTLTLLNPLETPTVIRNQLFETNARGLFVFPLFAQTAVQITKSLPQIRDVFLYGLPFTSNRAVEMYRRLRIRDSTTSHFSVLLRNPAPGPDTPVLGEPFQRPQIDPKNDVLMLPFSSGTTGRPKGVIHTHETAIAYVDVIVQYPPLVRMYNEDVAAGIEPNNFALLPMFHIFGFCMISMCFKLRGRNVINLRYHRKLFLRTIQKYKIRAIPVVPPLLDFLAQHPMVAKYDLSSIRLVFSGAAPLSKVTADKLMSKYPNIQVEQGYGMTECIISGTIDDGIPYTSAGQLMPNTEAMIIDVSSGKELDYNEVGELVIHSPAMMKGYFMNPVASAESFIVDAQGKKWLRTGDVGYFDADNVIYLVDRIKEMIKYKGHQVSPVEVELEIRTIPGVVDAAVVGIPDPKAGEVPLAFVVKKPDSSVTETTVKDHIRSQMLTYNELRGGVHFIDASPGIPRSVAGKIQRKELKAKALKMVHGDQVTAQQILDAAPQLTDPAQQLNDAAPQLTDVAPQLTDVAPQLTDNVVTASVLSREKETRTGSLQRDASS